MRILQFCTNFWPGGGIQTHVMDLTAWLRAHGHKVILAGDPERSIVDPNRHDFISLDMRKISRPDGNLIFRTWALIQAVMTLRRVISQQPVDLIHAHETGVAMVARLATLGTNIPVMMTFHGSEPERIPQAAHIAKYCADLTASPSRLSLEALMRHGVKASKARVLGLGIKHLPDISEADVLALRRSYLPEDNGVMIFSPSRLAPQKGIDVMIDVAKRVIAKHPNTVFVVAGGGRLTGHVEHWAQDAGVARNMRFLGPIDTVPAHLKAADIFLLTSRWEALPISIVEAFRAGLPVVATNCGGVSELVDESIGMLCPVEDVECLTQAVLDLIESADLRKIKGAAGLTRSTEDRFDSEAVHAAFEATYKELIADYV